MEQGGPRVQRNPLRRLGPQLSPSQPKTQREGPRRCRGLSSSGARSGDPTRLSTLTHSISLWTGRATAVAVAMAPDHAANDPLGLCRLLLGDRSLNVPDLGFQLRTELRDQPLNAPIRPVIKPSSRTTEASDHALDSAIRPSSLAMSSLVAKCPRSASRPGKPYFHRLQNRLLGLWAAPQLRAAQEPVASPAGLGTPDRRRCRTWAPRHRATRH